MKLNKDTRHLLKEGTILKQGDIIFEVTTLIPLRRGAQVTVKIVNYPDRHWEGHRIYAQPLSFYYGMEMLNS